MVIDRFPQTNYQIGQSSTTTNLNGITFHPNSFSPNYIGNRTQQDQDHISSIFEKWSDTLRGPDIPEDERVNHKNASRTVHNRG